MIAKVAVTAAALAVGAAALLVAGLAFLAHTEERIREQAGADA